MEKIKIYLDEDINPLLGEILRSRGYDVISCIEKGFYGLSDEEQLKIAAKEKRAILTHNVRDYVYLHRRCKGEHYGIIVSNQLPISILLKRVLKLITEHPLQNLKCQLIWLSNYVTK